MMPGPRNLITDVEGIRVGNSEDASAKTGTTVLVGEAPMVAGVHVMGGAPGTRETDLLRPDATVEGVDAVVLSGGSAFGLAAADGVVDKLRAAGRGYPVGDHRVPIVPAAILFDLMNGGDKNWDTSLYRSLGQSAFAASDVDFQIGSTGAGTGALVADLKGGLGSTSCVLPSGVTIGALAAVNAFGQATVGDSGQFWAAPWEDGAEFGALGVATIPAGAPRTKLGDGGNTTLGIVATDAKLSKAEATRLAIAAHDGFARSLVPSHTPMDGDIIFAVSTGKRDIADSEKLLLGHWAAVAIARSVARGVYAAHPAPGDIVPTWRERFGGEAG
ncbi:MAG: P1 family peptidase [Boseongicola sp.]|nr:P1 family peptidase [Boseongicola sp.]MDD9977216.1 P1 family peptidase [Boseongicola sp.]